MPSTQLRATEIKTDRRDLQMLKVQRCGRHDVVVKVPTERAPRVGQYDRQAAMTVRNKGLTAAGLECYGVFNS